MEYKDYYKILGIDRKATAAQIKKSYQKLARKFHPDVSKDPDAEKKFKEINEAYQVLRDETKRASYDQLGSSWQSGQQGFQPPPGWQFRQGGPQQTEEIFENEGFSDFFESLFGRGGAGMHSRFGGGRTQGHAYQQRGNDETSKINITLEEAYHGTERSLNIQDTESDPRTGQLKTKTRTLKVKIPTGVTEGQQIRLAGQGGRGLGGGANGDLYLEIHIQPHSLYTLQGRDIYLNLPITPWEAALGAHIPVPTPGGTVRLNIPPDSQSGNKLRLKGRGLPGTKPGDEYVVLKILTPPPTNEKQRELYQEMAKEMSFFDPRKDML